MKSSQKFEYRRFAEHLVDRGLADRDTINLVLEQCNSTGALLPEILVQEGHVSDWEIARVVCELYHVPFMTVEVCPPNADAMEGLDPDYLRQFGIVPLDRFGKVLTVIVPGIVPSTVLDGLVAQPGVSVIPVVGSVTSNRRWLNENLPAPEVEAMDGIAAALPDDGNWAGIFDAGEEGVQLELHDKDDPPPKPSLELRLRGESDDD